MGYNNQLPIVQQYFTNIAAIQNGGGGGGGGEDKECIIWSLWVLPI